MLRIRCAIENDAWKVEVEVLKVEALIRRERPSTEWSTPRRVNLGLAGFRAARRSAASVFDLMFGHSLLQGYKPGLERRCARLRVFG
jgi:hypothetical protein